MGASVKRKEARRIKFGPLQAKADAQKLLPSSTGEANEKTQELQSLDNTDHVRASTVQITEGTTKEDQSQETREDHARRQRFICFIGFLR